MLTRNGQKLFKCLQQPHSKPLKHSGVYSQSMVFQNNLCQIADFMKVNGIKHIRSAPYHPSTNGLAERFVQTFKRAMKTSAQDEPNLNTRLSQFLLGYRSTPHATTNVSPGELFLQRKLRTRFDLLKPNVESVVTTKQSDQKTYHDQHVKQ